MIDRLASKNVKPAEGEKGLSPHEERIWKAVDALNGLGVTAFPQLIAHFDDDRFSFSQDRMSGRGIRHESVGHLCWEIVERQVKKRVCWNVADPRGTPGHTGAAIVPCGKEAAEVWWEAHRDKKLWELQAESVRSVISANQKVLASEQDEDRRRVCEDAIRANEELLTKLLRTEAPIPTKPFRPYIGR